MVVWALEISNLVELLGIFCQLVLPYNVILKGKFDIARFYSKGNSSKVSDEKNVPL